MSADLYETVQTWDAINHEWRTVRTLVAKRATPAAPARASARPDWMLSRPMPRASDGSPIEDFWRRTAFAEQGPLADDRTYLKPAAMRTHRAPGILPVPDMGYVTRPEPT